MEIKDLEYVILDEIANKNFSNLTHQFFEISKTEFDNSIADLKKNGFIQGNIFDSNGSVKNPFRFFFLSEKGESLLSNTAV
ncbi:MULTISPECIES: hypothetical protein [Enterococcus]|uniref:Uncharacterized protein n=1 Tax=Candidatus Enterococcus murrayae TaxID=2815321 RepID=A0ABS3HIG8_9ENTE|nr:hypothetical protein [Enterococcus sp. MJM16]MBO0453249.1 hypothetical protein [Enterococcus sp. MJM16]